MSSVAASLRERALSFHIRLARVLGWFVRGFAWVAATEVRNKRDRSRSAAKRKVLMIMAFALIGLFFSFLTHARAGAPAACGPGAPGFIDDASNELTGMMSSWPQLIISAMSPVFWSILTFATITALAFELPKNVGNPAGVMLTLATCLFAPIMAGTFFMATPTLGPQIVDNMLGATAGLPAGADVSPSFTSLSGIAPGDAFMRYACIAQKIDDNSTSKSTGLDLLKNPVGTLVDAAAVVFGEIVCYVAGAIVMVALFMFKVEAVFVVGIGAVLMVGAAASLLYGFPLRYLGALIGLGLHGIALSFLTGVSLHEATRMENVFQPGKIMPPHDLLLASTVLLTLAVMVWKLPELLASIGGTAGFGPASGFAQGMTLQNMLNSFGNRTNQQSNSDGGGDGGGSGGGAGGGGTGGGEAAEASAASEIELVAAA